MNRCFLLNKMMDYYYLSKSEIEQVALRPGKADEIIVRGYGITLRRQIC